MLSMTPHCSTNQEQPLAGATIRVCAMPATGQPCTPLALIYSDAALTQALANPTTTDGLGNYFFYAAPGKYEIEISGPGITTKQIPNVILPSDPSSPTFTGAISAFSLSLTGNLTVNGNASVVGNLASGTLNLVNQGVAPGAAGAGTINLYTKTVDKRLYYKDDSGTEIGPIAASSGAQTNVVNTFTAAQNIDADFRNKGPNPWADISRFGGYFGPGTPPSTTGSITTGTAALTLGAAQDFANGHGILILGAGAAPTIATPTGLAISQANVVGTTTYNYCVVAEDYFGGRTACSAAAATTTGVATIGVQSATITTAVRTAGVVTVTTSAPHNYQVGAQVQISGTTGDNYMNATTTIVAAPSPTTFTYDQFEQPDRSNTGGTAQVMALNILKWNSDSTNSVLRSYIYRCTASCGVVGPNYALAGVSIGVDGYFQDWGFAMTVANVGNGDVPATAPTTASNRWLSTTITAGGGTTSLTLANNATTTVAGATVLHDNSPNIINACNSFSAGKGGTVYIPNANVSTNSFHIKSTLNMAGCPAFTQVQVANKLLLTGTIIASGQGQNWKGLPGGSAAGALPSSYLLRPLAYIGGYSFPFIYLSPTVGNGFSFDDFELAVYQPYESAYYQDQSTTGNGNTSVRFNNVHANAQGVSSAMVIKGGFGIFFDYGGWSNISSGTGLNTPPAMLFAVNCGLGISGQQFAYIVQTNHTYSYGTTQWDFCGQTVSLGLSDYTFYDTLDEAPLGPMFRFASTGAATTGGSAQAAAFQIIQADYADSLSPAGTPLIDSAFAGIQDMKIVNPIGNAGSLFTLNTGGIASRSIDVSGEFQGTVGALTYSRSAAGKFYNLGVSTSGTSGRFFYQMATPAPAQSAIVSAGGSVPVGARTYAVSAVDYSGYETILSTSISATTTSGNQTVTVTLPAAFPTGARGVDLYRDGNRVNAAPCAQYGGPQFTIPGGTFVDTFAAGCGNSASSSPQAGASLLDSNGVATPQLRLNSEALTASPRAEQNVFLPGALSTTWTASSWTLDKAVTVTRLQVQTKTAPAGCTTNAVVRLTDGTTPVSVTLSAAANDSGAITQNYAAGATLTIALQTAAVGCTTTPADANVIVQYKMQ